MYTGSRRNYYIGTNFEEFKRNRHPNVDFERTVPRDLDSEAN
jgi:hypothetical protein